MQNDDKMVIHFAAGVLLKLEQFRCLAWP